MRPKIYDNKDFHWIWNGFWVDFLWISEFWGSVLGVLLRKSRNLHRKLWILLRNSLILLLKISDFG